MTHMLRLSGMLLCVCGGVLLLALGIGHNLPIEDEIIFSAYRGYGIYRMVVARHLIAPLISTKSSLTQPDWSADGKRVAFVNNSSAQMTLYLADADGHNQHLLTTLAGSSDYDPQWSPDGRFIAYSTSRREYESSRVIDVMLLDTGTQTSQRITTTNIFREHMLSWSPDGTQIAFVLYSPIRGNSDLFSIHVQTGVIHNLVSTSGNDEYPVWSPDGHYIAFVGGDVSRGLYVLDTTTGQTDLLYTLSGVSSPSDWSQDSRFIFLTLAHNIYTVDVSACLKDATTCRPELLIAGAENARRKPRVS